MRLVKACRSIFRMQLILRLQYRAAAWAKMLTFIFWGLVHAAMMLIFFRFGRNAGAGISAGMSVDQAVAYGWLVQLVAPLLPIMAADNEVWEKIRNGEVGVELCRPLDLYAHWFTRAAATRLAPFLLQLAPVAAVAMLLPAPYHLPPPASPEGFFACLLAIGAGLLLSCACLGMTYALLLKVRWGEGPAWIMLITADVLSGSYLPLQLWPEWTQPFLSWQPFAGLLDLPLRFYVGTMAAEAVWRVVLFQLTWAVILAAAGWFWTGRSLKRLVIQGG